LRQQLIEAQRNEITEHHIYLHLARQRSDEHNREVLRRIAEDERRHYDFWAEHTGARPGPRRATLWLTTFLCRFLGLTFTVKMMERGEEQAQAGYDAVIEAIPEARKVIEDETAHERELTSMLDEEALRYVGSVVLGLSDALVELTGALAGLTLALQDSSLIAASGLITGIAASLSMAASEFLATRAEGDGTHKTPVRAAVYTGGAYVATVAILIAPFLLLEMPLVALPITLALAILIILIFTFYISVAQERSFWRRFGEMAGLSLGVAAVSFGIGFLVRTALGVEA
jgi:VIT1/CCC1 family predicted Fe2+/Mn2+ transporter